MSKGNQASNGVIRIGRKGLKKFAIGEEDDPRKLPVFEVDVVVSFQEWIGIDEEFRFEDGDVYQTGPKTGQEVTTDDVGTISTDVMSGYHKAAVHFVTRLMDGDEDHPAITVAEALDFIARLREQYDELAVFFRPRSRERPDSPGTSEAELRFSVEAENSTTSTS